jgi:capsular polysaccharide biosynthesis protein
VEIFLKENKMNNPIQKEEFSLLDLLKVLWSKIKILILVFLCGGIVGGVAGVVTTYDVNYWGTSLEFYVNPDAPISQDGRVTSNSTYGVYGAYGRHVMDNIVKLLSGESFTEEMMKNFDNAPTEKYLPDGRINPEYKTFLYKIRNSVKFSYIAEEEDLEDAINLARSFIYVNISVLGDENKEFANELVDCVRKSLVPYVEENMIVPDGYKGTSCTEITTVSEIELTNPLHTTKTAIKYGLLAAAAALVIACVVVIIIDRSDKRVRDYEQVARQLNIPVLGIVPTIDEEKINAWNEAMKGGREE